ncbi:unnamed protein product [Calypogeia fissa]
MTWISARGLVIWAKSGNQATRCRMFSWGNGGAGRGWKHCGGKGEEDNDLVATSLCSTILSRKANVEALLPGSRLRKSKAWVGYCWTVAGQQPTF